MHKEAGGFDIELFADVLTDLDQVTAALAAGAGFRFMMMFDARQMIRQRLATGARTRRLLHRRRLDLLLLFLCQPGFDGGNVAGQGFLEQVTLFTGKGFASGAIVHPAQVGQLEDERLNLGLGGVKVGVATGDLPSGFGSFFLCLIDEFLNGADDPVREFWSSVQSGQFSV